ncbi:MAG TPA: helix-turn-helix domain-containing protein [Actinocrinis sp.]|nr:helix-turn-helix domain-containing protein [Actinocrinis sp.]
MTDHSPRPLRRDAEQNRQRIMAAAREVFAQRGFGASLDEIAEHAGLGVGTVYRRFANKNALIDALFEQAAKRLTDLARTAAQAQNAWEGLVDLLTAIAELQVTDRGLRDLILSGRVSPDRNTIMRENLKPLIDPLVRRAQEQGCLRRDFDGADIAVIQLMLSAAYEFTRPCGPAVWRRYLTMMFDAMRECRDAPTPLPHPPLDEDGLGRAMLAWPLTRLP